jgi:hypothetical protein
VGQDLAVDDPPDPAPVLVPPEDEDDELDEPFALELLLDDPFDELVELLLSADLPESELLDEAADASDFDSLLPSDLADSAPTAPARESVR